MPRIKKLTEAVPKGYRYVLPATGFDLQKAMPHRSFTDCVKALHAHVRGNLHVVAQSGVPTDYDGLARAIESYTAKELQREGYTNFIIEDAPAFEFSPPKMMAPQLSKPVSAVGAVKTTVAGIGVYLDWLGEGGKPVPKSLAEDRGAICVSGAPQGKPCPFNQPGDWKTFFTEKAAAGILSVFGMMNDLDLSTIHDEQLGVCGVCSCPLKSKVWTPIEHIKKNTSAETMEKFPEFCWIKKESHESLSST